MLDLLLRWASLEGAVSQFSAATFDQDDEEHADEITNRKMSMKLREIDLALRPHLPELAAVIGKLKKEAERYGKLRDTIAHCHCAGMLKSKPRYLVFLRYRRHTLGGLSVDHVPLEMFDEAKRFAEHVRSVVERLNDAIRSHKLPE